VPDAVKTKGLAKIFIHPVYAKMGGRIKKAANPDGCIDNNVARIFACNTIFEIV